MVKLSDQVHRTKIRNSMVYVNIPKLIALQSIKIVFSTMILRKCDPKIVGVHH